MLKNKTIMRCCFIALVLAFCYGLVQLFLLRFQSGDVYPPYSSLRSDPLGTRALYESLVLINPAAVSRNYNPFPDIQFEDTTSFMYLGATVFDPEAVSEDFAETVDQLTTAGGRLVLAFLPLGKSGPKCLPCDDNHQEESESSDGAGSKAETGPEPDSDAGPSAENAESKKPQTQEESADDLDHPFAAFKSVSLKDQWGVSFEFDDTAEKQRRAIVSDASGAQSLSDSIAWHSTLYFDELDKSWRVLYRQYGKPVIVERHYKEGSILLCADAFVFSNEALRSERHSEVLTRLIGPHNHIVFDEAHLGIHKVPGVAELIRRFGFHWFFASVALLFALFIWKNSASFVPPADDAMESNANQGRDSAQGLVSLLRRNIPKKNVLAVGIAEWKKSFGYTLEGSIHSAEQATIATKVEQAAERNHPDPVKAYNTICKLLMKRN